MNSLNRQFKNQNSNTMKQNFIILKSLFIITIIIISTFGCRKQDFDASLPKNDETESLRQSFFNTSSISDLQIKKLANDIKRQDSIFKFLPAFANKNGKPRWDKVLYKTSSKKGKKTGTNLDSNPGSDTSKLNNGENQGVFFIPLQSQTSPEIKSYITAYKHNDSLYTYRLYNKDSLNQLNPGSDATKNNLLNTQAVFGYFENTINNIDSVNINAIINGTIKGVNIKIEEGINSDSNNISLNSFPSSGSCIITLTVTIEYSLEIWIVGSNVWIKESITQTMTLSISCDGGGGGGCGCGDPTGGNGNGSGSGSGSGSGNWWQYGSGWPWNTGGGGNYDPNWYWWWTGGGGGGGGGVLPYEIIPDPNILGNFNDDPNIFEDDPTAITFDVIQDLWPIISNVLSPSEFVGYDYRNCLTLAKDQISKAGLIDLGYGSAYKIYDAQGGPYPNVTKEGVEYIITKLQAGKPVIVGVDNRPGTPSATNADGKTDHFVTIVGSGQDAQGKYFTFYDNATNLESKGTSPLNRLYYDETTGVLSGKSAAPYANTYYDYIVTQIRKNK